MGFQMLLLSHVKFAIMKTTYSPPSLYLKEPVERAVSKSATDFEALLLCVSFYTDYRRIPDHTLIQLACQYDLRKSRTRPLDPHREKSRIIQGLKDLEPQAHLKLPMLIHQPYQYHRDIQGQLKRWARKYGIVITKEIKGHNLSHYIRNELCKILNIDPMQQDGHLNVRSLERFLARKQHRKQQTFMC